MATNNPITTASLVDTDWLQGVDQAVGRDITGGAPGWFPAPDTWVYVAAGTFKIVGKNVAARYPVGTKLSYTDSGAKYSVVVSAAFVTDTTITCIGDGLTGGVISNARYSYASTPYGFPAKFAHTPAYSGWAATPTFACWFSINGRLLTYYFAISGTSNATSASITLPVAAAAATAAPIAIKTDNGADDAANVGNAQIAASSATLAFVRTGSGNTWTASGTKAVNGQITIPI
ncbi:MAG: hypothetical protein M0R37_12810 [Bacteroidales bacterium]|nr:hypothetical protein [Bacteroidales bacterium]